MQGECLWRTRDSRVLLFAAPPPRHTALRRFWITTHVVAAMRIDHTCLDLSKGVFPACQPFSAGEPHAHFDLRSFFVTAAKLRMSLTKVVITPGECTMVLY